MTDPPRPTHVHIWDGDAVPAWLGSDQHWFDHDELVIRTPDGHARPKSGWWLIGWAGGWVTVATPTIGEREYGPDGVYSRLAQAEQSLDRVTRLYEQWVQEGSPPLGVPMGRWWDSRLAQMREAILRR
ncbi:hypothetical protein AB0D34_07630 [Streptomyces sp. NPDC048420]|uniref:hypothetical protein n=1 Tax=Streptomyces sp. NPDC048420 TaxID=3155755 RepID=UPI00341EB001